jgi:hypothetical protein
MGLFIFSYHSFYTLKQIIDHLICILALNTANILEQIDMSKSYYFARLLIVEIYM